MCDMTESFNSNNLDHFSNVVAEKFARENRLATIAEATPILNLLSVNA